jgi:hypothetical protein
MKIIPEKMKRYPPFLLLLIIFNYASAQKFEFVKCISGDCVNGKGVAEFTTPSLGEISGTVVYNGTFKDGKMSGEGTISNEGHYYAGNFEDNYYRGYGTRFFIKRVGNVTVPDSAGYVDFFNWDEDGCNNSMTLQPDNRKIPFHHGISKHKKFWESSPLKDEWIMQHVNEVIASSARGHVVQYDVSIIAQKNLSAPKGSPVSLISWDCLADRQYFVTASATANGKYAAMPFNGHVDYQVSAGDGTVVFEGPVDKYWKPLKDGKYTFTVKFDQGEIIGNGNAYVDGVSLSCSLRSRRQL